MESDDIKKIVVKASSVIDRFEERGDKVVEANILAVQQLTQTVQNAAFTSERITAKALDNFEEKAGEVLLQGMREPLKACDNTLQASAYRIEAVTHQLTQKMQIMQKMHSANAWKAFIASAVASLAIIGVAVYMMINARQEIKRADWVSGINAAIANGKLTACMDGGVCVNIDKKQVRLDK